MGMCALGNLPNMMNTLDMFLTPLCQGACWAPGYRALELTKPVFLQCEICTEYVYAGLFFETKTSWTYFHCTDKYCLNAVKTVDCELEAPSGGFTVPFKP